VLEGAQTVVVLLLVFNFLGALSAPVRVTIQRAGAPIPTIRIAGEIRGVRTLTLTLPSESLRRRTRTLTLTLTAPPLLAFRSDTTVGLIAAAATASCFVSAGSSISVAFNWTVVKVVLMPGTSGLSLAPPGLDATSKLSNELIVEGSSFTLGLRYTLRVTACMLSQPGVCGAAETDVVSEVGLLCDCYVIAMGLLWDCYGIAM
jgi:hypothetical protein